ncbi:MAG: PbsX family transcriptional regulator [Sphingomonas sp.]
MAAAALHIDQQVDVREEDGRVIIEPVRALPHDLSALIEAMTPDTFPEQIDFGGPVGREVW